ncbi:MAG: dimethyl sulfoxide reductase anchor subunit [Verrucomicrobiaceae bacterium]|nr:dimethyl sulfoxide reductase anchor subunit [Verrucomicrobiaceae bacterium]
MSDSSDLLASVLKEQRTLRTPVALFSEEHESKSVRQRFSHLIPLSKPGPGEQYAFEVNLDACTGCKACVAACHSLNGLDEDESWRDVGALVGTRKQPYLQTVTSACHHCADPACSNGCPVLAYEKDEATGIVRHLDDQCIGCSYCILKCPYDVPKFNVKRGIVRKCDMCHGRLAAGEAPACVQSCPNEAIKIRVVSKSSETITSTGMLPCVFPSDYTQPTTRYVSAKPLPTNAQPADASRLMLDEGHEPLAWMLVLTQMSAGAFVACAAALWSHALDLKLAGFASAAALFTGVVGILLSVLHLGQPLKAWRAFLGWRKSWLSREIIAFGGFAGAGMSTIAAWCMSDMGAMRLTLTAAALAGLAAVACSVMVYVDTRKQLWSLANVSGKFLGTTLLLGAALCATVWEWSGAAVATWAIGFTLAIRWALSAWELAGFRNALEDENSAWHRSARILHERLRGQMDARAFLLVATGLVIPTLIAAGASSRWMLAASLALTFWSQLIERRYFFTAAAGSKMPGN